MHGNTCCQEGSCGPEKGGAGMCGFCRGPLGHGHTALCSMTALAGLLFVLGAVSLVGAWVVEVYATTWMGFGSGFLLGNAAVFFILSLMFKIKKRWLKRKLMKKMWMGGGCSECGCSSGGACGTGGCGEGGCSSGSCGTGGGCGPEGCGPGGCGPECTPEGCGKEGCCKA